jgi:hypothetical protein
MSKHIHHHHQSTRSQNFKKLMSGSCVRFGTCGRTTSAPKKICWYLVGGRSRIWQNVLGQKTVAATPFLLEILCLFPTFIHTSSSFSCMYRLTKKAGHWAIACCCANSSLLQFNVAPSITGLHRAKNFQMSCCCGGV